MLTFGKKISLLRKLACFQTKKERKKKKKKKKMMMKIGSCFYLGKKVHIP